MIVAIVMAGGKGKRLKADCEKPLFPIKNKCLIDYVLDNLNQSELLDKIVVAVSPNTLNTKNYLIDKYSTNPFNFNNNDDNKDNFNKSKISYLETPGDGYLEDLSFILDTFNFDSPNHILLFINSDLPLINSKIINHVLDVYNNSPKPALSVYVPVEIFEKYGLDYSYQFNGNVPSGLNILLSQNIIQEEEELIIRCMELAFNVNTIDTVKYINQFL